MSLFPSTALRVYAYTQTAHNSLAGLFCTQNNHLSGGSVLMKRHLNLKLKLVHSSSGAAFYDISYSITHLFIYLSHVLLQLNKSISREWGVGWGCIWRARGALQVAKGHQPQQHSIMTVTEFFPASPHPHPVILGDLLVLSLLVGEAVCQVEGPEAPGSRD